MLYENIDGSSEWEGEWSQPPGEAREESEREGR